MTALIITGDRNTRRSDYTGAFLPESLAFRRAQGGGNVVRVNLAASAVEMRSTVLTAIRNHAPDHLAIFCHGYVSGLQLGLRRVHAAELARALAAVRCEVVTLYACSTGGGGTDGDGGFADRLRDEMCRAGLVGCRVDGHDRAGHATRLPFVRRFEGGGSPVGGTGGSWIVAPGSELWPRWRQALATTDLRFRFARMSAADVHLELLGA